MEASEFRTALASFAGPDRYRQFLRALNGEGRWRGRFLYWQEELLARFAAAVPSAEVAFERVEPRLRVCELHGAELAADPERVSQRCRGAVTEYARAAAEWFPNTDCGPVVVGRRFDNFRRGRWFCPACRAAEAEWVQMHSAPDAAVETAANAVRWEQTLAQIRAQRCPSCGSCAAALYCYGLPDYSDGMSAALDAKLVFLGGCTIFEDSPEWLCRNCYHTWGRAIPAAPQDAEPGAAADGRS